MPIHLDISHLDRVVIAVVIGGATVAEVSDLARRFAESGTRHYRKIVDTTAGFVETSDEAEVAAVAGYLRGEANGSSRGPLAFVVDPKLPQFFAERFVELTSAERPVKIFQSLRAARKWLDELSPVDPRR